MIDELITFDQSLFLQLNGLHNSFWDVVMWWVSDTKIWIPLYAFFIYSVVKKYKFNWKILYVLVPIVALLILSADKSSVYLFKNVFQRLRPSHEPVLDGLVHIVNGKRGGQWGFVSSHAANSFALAVFLLRIFKTQSWTIFLLFWAVLVSYSRIYLGVHYPGDILGGAILGSLWGILWSAIFHFSVQKWSAQLKITT